MGNHIDNRTSKRKKVKEYDEDSRRQRASFKQYLRNLKEESLEDDFDCDYEQHDDLDFDSDLD